MPAARGWAARGPATPLAPWSFARREPGPRDVELELLYCGICHSDLHQARDEWGGSSYPMVPGHEIVGRVSARGARARKFSVGDPAAVGCMVDSCRRCANCRRGLEQHCLERVSFTYNSVEQDGVTRTQGGYSDRLVVHEDFAFTLPPGQALERAAPLLCAGITTYSPLKRWKAGKGKRVGVLGLGGLGHAAVKIAAAMGAEVTVLSRSAAKRADAARLGAHGFLLAPGAEPPRGGRFDILIDTVSADHDVDAALGWLGTEGVLVMVGIPPKPLSVSAGALIGGRRKLEGSGIGGLAETQEMLDFCAKKKVLADVEVIAMKDVNAAYDRLARGDVRYRFVLDLKTL